MTENKGIRGYGKENIWGIAEKIKTPKKAGNQSEIMPDMNLAE